MVEPVAVLLDGEFVKKTLGQRSKRFPDLGDITGEVERILKMDDLADHTLYRIFYYAADPLSGSTRHPMSGQEFNFGKSVFDIASLALNRLVSTIVLVAGDSDFVPAMKLARREGLRVLLDPLGEVPTSGPN